MGVELLAAAFAAGALAPERIPAAAVSLMEHGWDSPSLRLAAGSDRDEPDQQRAWMRAGLEELDQLPITPDEVAARFTTHWAKRVVSGEVEPLDAAGELWRLIIRHDVTLPDDSLWARGALDPDEYAAPEIKAAYERDIRAGAERWLLSRSA